MYNAFKEALLRLLSVPPEPQPPAGASGSLRRFRAAPNYYRLLILRWLLKQISAVIGIVVAIVFLHAGPGQAMMDRRPMDNFAPVILIFEAFGVVTFFLQLPITFMMNRLDYELRWYLVTDRSLRIREGIWVVEELTMTYANIQELTIHQGPLQRFLGIADLKVRSAGGGGVQQQNGQTVRETHVAYFRGVDNASEIRDVIVAHLRRQRDTGLGDPDASAVIPETSANPEDAVIAAREVLEEVRNLRRTLTTNRA